MSHMEPRPIQTTLTLRKRASLGCTPHTGEVTGECQTFIRYRAFSHRLATCECEARRDAAQEGVSHESQL
jgi:hypothetical protein